MDDTRFLTRVRIRNYKSIVACDVELQPLTFLVGPNGSGKSNFLDALSFLSDLLRMPVEEALVRHGGMHSIVHSGSGHTFDIEIHFRANEFAGSYGVEIARHEGDRIELSERFEVDAARNSHKESWPSHEGAPRLALDNRSDARFVCGCLRNISFFDFVAEVLKRPPIPSSSSQYRLAPDGRNLPSMLRRLEGKDPEAAQKVGEYLRAIVPAVREVQVDPVGPYEIVKFTMEFGGPVAGTLYAPSMSDGTLRALALLVGLFSAPLPPVSPLVVVEEPEAGLHPGAAGVIWDALSDASCSTQVLAATHSPDLLDHKNVSVNSILAVILIDGRSVIAPLDEAGKSMLGERLFTAGELLRINQLSPKPAHAS
jgi:predicted ATPase